MTATNFLGDSFVSEAGNGAVILTYPDEPNNLVINSDVTFGTIVGLSWLEGDQSGGRPILDYTVMAKDSATETWAEREVGVVGTSVTLTGLNLGLTYTFKVKSRNVFDFSQLFSNEVAVLTAINPDEPSAPSTSVSGDNVIITWTAPNDNGLQIQAYTVLIQKKDPAFYAVDYANCDGTQASIIAAMQCTIPITTLMASPFDLSWGDSVTAKV